MSPAVREAIDAAREGRADLAVRAARPTRRWSFERVHYLVLAVLREVPDGMTVAELRDELEIANNLIEDKQSGDHR